MRPNARTATAFTTINDGLRIEIEQQDRRGGEAEPETDGADGKPGNRQHQGRNDDLDWTYHLLPMRSVGTGEQVRIGGRNGFGEIEELVYLPHRLCGHGNTVSGKLAA